MKIYTKTGDKGTTQLIGGPRVSKAHPQVIAYGTLDELNAHLGLVAALNTQHKNHPLMGPLLQIQNDLFVIGSQLACADESFRPQLPNLPSDRLPAIESWIDEMTSQLPELKQFILPGGSPSASAMHLARTVCRRAERELIATNLSWSEPFVMYLNRLSDALFVAARFLNYLENIGDIPWKKP